MKLKIRRKKSKSKSKTQAQSQGTGPLQVHAQSASASASALLLQGEHETQKDHQYGQQRRRRWLRQRQRQELNKQNQHDNSLMQRHVHSPSSDHHQEDCDGIQNSHEHERRHKLAYAGSSSGKSVSIGNGNHIDIDTSNDFSGNISRNFDENDANHIDVHNNEFEHEHEDEGEHEGEGEHEQQPFIMNPSKEMSERKEIHDADKGGSGIIIPNSEDFRNVELELDLDSKEELNSDRPGSESGSDLDTDLNLNLNVGPSLLSESQSLSQFASPPPIDTIDTDLQRSTSSITSPLGNYGADHYHNLYRNSNNTKQSDHTNGNDNDNIRTNTHHTNSRRSSLNTFTYTNSTATSKINNNNHKDGRGDDYETKNSNSKCNSLNNSITKQISISQNINNIIMKNFHNTAFVFIKPHANTEKTQQLVRSTLLDSINPFSCNYSDDDDDDDDNDGRTGRILSEYDITSDVIQNNDLVDKHYKTISKYATGIRGSISCRTKIQADKFKSTFQEDLDTVLKERRIYNALEALSACACTPQLLNDLWVEAEGFRTEDGSRQKHNHLKKVVKFDRGYYCGNLLIHNKNVYVINGFYMALRQSYVEPGRSIHAYVVQWNTPSLLSSSIRSTSVSSTLGSTTLQWHQFRDKVIGSTDPREAADGSLRRLIYDQYVELGIDCEHRPTALNNAIHVSASPLEGLAEQISWLQQDVNSVEYGRVLLGRGVPESVILDWCHDLDVKVPNRKTHLNGDTNQHKNGNRNGSRTRLWRGQQGSNSSSKLSFSYQSPYELVQNLDAKECSDKLIGLYDYQLFGASEQQSKCCKFKCN